METSTKTKINMLTVTAVKVFEDFMKSFAQNKTYVLKDTLNHGFTKDDINHTYTRFCEKSKGDPKFNDVVNEFLESKGFQDSYLDVLNHAIWLWALPNARKTSWVLKDVNDKDWKKRYNDK